ncbi:regulatory protein [Daejeonella rubra]|uniref:Regulatory protein RecX n=1 Tax=Daejeonella rubra TaxID=990371 RepID=A0A1G9XAC5_9SPHI|nr:regulatory protein RecX [Daejeonella rubra]SDM93688.1 regulatory protein [Daejeonella rubra]
MRNEEPSPKIFSREQAKVKAESYCAYQERSQFEIRNKLYEWGLHQKDVEEIISELIEQNFLNEERFALAYSLGKFRIKGWGKIKIRQGLKLKRIPDKLILKSLKAIDDDDYLSMLKKILEKKSKMISEKEPFKLRYLLTRFAASKGYELDLITDLLINNKLD